MYLVRRNKYGVVLFCRVAFTVNYHIYLSLFYKHHFTVRMKMRRIRRIVAFIHMYLPISLIFVHTHPPLCLKVQLVKKVQKSKLRLA